MGLLQALLANESGGRNIANTTQGTSSGQAQGYFQITTGTWNDFGGTKYAPTPMQATYAQQAEIASKIPLKRWDESTVAKMRATGIPIDPNKPLGENLAAAGESFGSGATGAARVSGPVEAAGGGAGSDAGAKQLYGPPTTADILAAAVADKTPNPFMDLANAETGGNPFAGIGMSDSASNANQNLIEDFPAPPRTPPLAYEDAAPALAQSPALPPPSLAGIFQVADIGNTAALVDPITGLPRTRGYG